MANVDPIPFADFIVARMLRTTPGFAGAPRAVAETEIRSRAMTGTGPTTTPRFSSC
jgi:hypothetical protein